MRYPFHTLDVFTDRIFSGNPLAVLPDARGLTDAQMQRVAAEFNFSETAFVLPPTGGGTRRVRIFTPRRELPFAGHPTVGTAVLLAQLGAVSLTDGAASIVLEERVGPIRVSVRARDGKPTYADLTAAMLPEFTPAPVDPAGLAAVLRLEESEILVRPDGPAIVSCGLPFFFVPLRDRRALGRAQINLPRAAAILSDARARELYLFTTDAELPGSDIRARLFAPFYGIAEDPATGSAAAALAGILARRAGAREGTLRWTVEQGMEMGRPSILHVEADVSAGGIAAVRVGGSAVRVAEGTLEIP